MVPMRDRSGDSLLLLSLDTALSSVSVVVALLGEETSTDDGSTSLSG